MNFFADFVCPLRRALILLVLSTGFFCSCIAKHHPSAKHAEEKASFETHETLDLIIFDESDAVSVGQASLSLFDETDEYTEYIVRGGDTLMLIAFNLYGDYLRWREIYEWNRDVLNSSKELSEGMRLKLSLPLKPYQTPTGLPYLIKPGDSLSLISRKVYGDMSEWPRKIGRAHV